MSEQKRHQKGAPVSQGGKYAPQERAVAAVELDPPAMMSDGESDWLLQHLADGGYSESTLHSDGTVAETKYYDAEERHLRSRTFEAGRLADGAQRTAGDAYYQAGKLHNAGPDIPALRTWENGELRVTVWMEHGNQQDPKPGVPAFVAQAEHGEQMRGHYQRGVLQDPEPGVPAHVATIDGGRMKRSTFATMGTATRQVDEVQLPGVAGAPNLVATMTLTAE